MNYKLLLEYTINILDTFNIQLEGVDEHASNYFDENEEVPETDRIFIIEVFSGCIQHRRILDVTVDRFYLKDGNTCLRAHQNLYKALCYIACFRIEEIGISKFSKLVMSQDPYQMMKFLSYLFNEDYINTWLSDEWSKTYDPDYVQQELVRPMLQRLPKMKEIISKLKTRIEKVEIPKQAKKKPTDIKPFDITRPKPKVIMSPEKIPVMPKHKAVPETTYKPSAIQIKLDKLKEENKHKSQERLEKSEKTKPKCSDVKKSSTYHKIVSQEKQKEEAKLDFNKKHFKMGANVTENPIPVKLNATAILREGALITKKEEEELKRLAALEAGQRDSSAFEDWRNTMREKDKLEQLAEIERKRLKGRISHEEAILARQALAKDNQETAKSIKAENKEMMKRYLDEKLKEERKMRLLVEKIIFDKENIKEAKAKLQDYKQNIVKEVNKESQELMKQALEEAEQEMKRKIELIQQIKALESVPIIRTKFFDITETNSPGFLNDMSIAELRERLTMMKITEEEEEEKKRDDILESKRVKNQFLMDTLETISKHRTEQSKQAALKLETKLRHEQPRPELNDKQVIELKKQLEAKKAERRITTQKEVNPEVTLVNDKTCRAKQLTENKKALDRRRLEQLETGGNRSALAQSYGLNSKHDSNIARRIAINQKIAENNERIITRTTKISTS